MFLKSLSSVVLTSLVFSFGLLSPLAHADIITDIEELGKPPEKKKDEGKKLEESDKAPPPVAERPDPIPEPADEIIPPPTTSTDKGGKKKKAKSKEERQKSPIHLKSDGTSTYSRDRSTVVLQKNVIITQDDMRLQSDEARVSLQPGGASEGGVKSAILNGKVAISRYSDDPAERMNAKSDKAVFDNIAQIVTFEGNARLWRDGSLIKGDRIVYEISTGMIKVDRAQGVVQPERMKK